MKSVQIVAVMVSVLCLHAGATAQVVEYIDCEVRDPASFVAANETFYNALAGGYRPTVSIDANIWNGTDPWTHTIIVAYEDHAGVEAVLNRVDEHMADYQQYLNSMSNVASCANEGLVVELGSWGDTDVAWEYYAVYPLYVTDGARYADAFNEYAESIVDDAPGPIILYQNRAGEEDTTHILVFFSPSLASLNEFLDNISTGDAYADFVDEVRSIRTLHSPEQARRIITWEP